MFRSKNVTHAHTPPRGRRAATVAIGAVLAGGAIAGYGLQRARTARAKGMGLPKVSGAAASEPAQGFGPL